MIKEYSNIILIDFDMLVDTDYGIIKLIDDKYCDENVFYKEITSLPEERLKGKLHERTELNPLSIIMKDKDKELMGSLYEQFMEEEYENIIDCSVVTSLYEFATTSMNSDGVIDITVLCRNYLERDIVINTLLEDIDREKYNVVIGKDIYDVSPYNLLMIKSINRLFDFENTEGCSIYLADLVFNFDQEKLKLNKLAIDSNIVKLYGSINEFYFMSMYPYDESYFDEDYDYEESRKSPPVPDIDIRKNEFAKMIFGDIERGLSTPQDDYDPEEDPYYDEEDEELITGDEVEEDDFDPEEYFKLKGDD